VARSHEQRGREGARGDRADAGHGRQPPRGISFARQSRL